MLEKMEGGRHGGKGSGISGAKRNLTYDARSTSPFQQEAGLFPVGEGQRQLVVRVSTAVDKVTA